MELPSKEREIIYAFAARVRELALAMMQDLRRIVTTINKAQTSGEENLSADSEIATNHVKELLTLIKEQMQEPLMKNMPAVEVYLPKLLVIAQAIEDAVTETIQAAKTSIANPFDFMTKQRLENSCKTVADWVQKLTQTVKLVVNPPTQPTNNLSKSGDAKANTHIALIKRFIASLQSLENCCKTNNKETLSATLKALSTYCAELVQTVKQNPDLANYAEELKESTVSVMLIAKVAFARPVDQYLRQLQEAMHKAVELLKTIVENIQPKSASMVVEPQKPVPQPVPSPTKAPEVSIKPEEMKKEKSDEEIKALPTPTTPTTSATPTPEGTPSRLAKGWVGYKRNSFGPSGAPGSPMTPSKSFSISNPSTPNGSTNGTIAATLPIELAPTEIPTSPLLIVEKLDEANAVANQDPFVTPLLKLYGASQRRGFSIQTLLNNTDEALMSTKFSISAINLSATLIEYAVKLNEEISCEDGKVIEGYSAGEVYASTLLKAYGDILSSLGPTLSRNASMAVELVYKQCCEMIKDTGSKGQPDRRILVASEVKENTRLVEKCLKFHMTNGAANLRSLTTQLVSLLCSLKMIADDTSLLQLCALINASVNSIKILLCTSETNKYIRYNDELEIENESVEAAPAETEQKLKSIWEDIAPPLEIDMEAERSLQMTPSRANLSIPSNSGPSAMRKAIGSLNQIVKTVTTPDKNVVIERFVRTVLLTYRTFTSPSTLLDKIIERFNVPADKIASMEPDAVKMIKARAATFLKYWVESFFTDLDDLTLNRIKNFAEEKTEEIPDLANAILKEIETKTSLRRYESLLSSMDARLQLRVLEPFMSPYDLLDRMAEQTIAQQLTLLDFQYFKAIEAVELLDLAWNKDEKKYRAPNVVRLIENANKTTMWVASTILSRTEVTDRAKAISKWISVSEHLKTLNNFAGLMAVVGGLMMTAVAKLKKSYSLISPQKAQELAELKKIIDPSQSFAFYKEEIAKAQLPAIPFIGRTLTELSALEEVTAKAPDGLINFQKRESLFTKITETLKYQSEEYNIPVVEPVYTYLLNLPSIEQPRLNNLSQQYASKEKTASTGEEPGEKRSGGGVKLRDPKVKFGSGSRPSTPKIERPVKKKRSEKEFIDLFDDDDLMKEFQTYLMQMVAFENLLFYKEVLEFEKLDPVNEQDKLRREAQRLFNIFIADENIATMPIGFETFIKNDIEDALNSANNIPNTLFSTAKSATESILNVMFSEWKKQMK